jgi:hypothetical protein
MTIENFSQLKPLRADMNNAQETNNHSYKPGMGPVIFFHCPMATVSEQGWRV